MSLPSPAAVWSIAHGTEPVPGLRWWEASHGDGPDGYIARVARETSIDEPQQRGLGSSAYFSSVAPKLYGLAWHTQIRLLPLRTTPTFSRFVWHARTSLLPLQDAQPPHGGARIRGVCVACPEPPTSYPSGVCVGGWVWGWGGEEMEEVL